MKPTIPSALFLKSMLETALEEGCDSRASLPPRITRRNPGSLVSAYQLMQYRPTERLHANSFQLQPSPLVAMDRAASLQGQLCRQRDEVLNSSDLVCVARTAVIRNTPSCRFPWLHSGHVVSCRAITVSSPE
jgi:hypothetical protein